MRGRTKLAAILLCALMAPVAAACDREDRRDVEEGVNDVGREVDQADKDGKDD